MQLNKAVKQSIGIDQIDYIAKYVSSAYVAIVFIGLARQWPHLMAEWTRVEQKMHKYGFPKKLNKQVTIIISFFITAFLVEYVLHQASRIDRVMECQSDKDRAIQFFFGNLTLSHVFQYIPYNIPTSLIFQYWVYQMEFGFTYTDIFVTVISMCLAERMRQVTKRVKLACAKEIADEQIWKEIRKDYTRLQSLIELVNDKISNIILISFLPNIFTILTQVYSTLKPKHNNTEAVYFYFSLIFLVSRTVTVCICGAKVNEESRRPLNILNSVPHTIYNDEIEIFISQISNFEIAMNGKHFFNIKKNVILENIQYLLLGIFSAVVHHDNCPTSKQFTKEIQLYGISSMIIRLILVSFIGGSINSENENLIDLLTSVPSNMYNKEVERFLNHVASREMILTGGNYFKITRSLILQIANALVTYELVIIQFVQNFKHIE
ncbi:hypothetical protein HUJ04_002965 [Dendroctonus ponderosae]|nr:hypothetical protein HUJ04_002965 [Dendroctonus ponderosae]